MVTNALRESNLNGFTLERRGKVRDVWNSTNPSRCIAVTTDRISVFDVVLQQAIPGKGAVLNRMSRFFLELLDRKMGVAHHLLLDPSSLSIVADIEENYPDLAGRVALWRRAEPFPVEFIIRAHLTGSYWKEYAKGVREIHGHSFPDGLTDGDKLPRILFTPSTKAEVGHDQNIDDLGYDKLVGDPNRAEALAARTVTIGNFIYDYCKKQGIIFLDSKFEWGRVKSGSGSQLLLIDEAVTPDSSRFVKLRDWRAERLDPFDKQLVRNYVLEAASGAGLKQGQDGFDEFVRDLTLPEAIIEETARRYQEIEERLCS